MQNLAKSQLILSIAVCLLGIAFVVQSISHIQLKKRVRCLEFGMTYVGDEFCGKHELKDN